MSDVGCLKPSVWSVSEVCSSCPRSSQGRSHKTPLAALMAAPFHLPFPSSAHTPLRCILGLPVHWSYLAGGGVGFFAQRLRSLLLHINKDTGVSEAYGRAIGTNFGFSSIAQSPPPEPELPLPRKRRGALAREGGGGQSLRSLLFVPLARPR